MSSHWDSPKTGPKKKKKSFFSRLPGSRIVKQTVIDAKNMASGAPGAFVAQGTAFGKDIAKGDYRVVGGIPIPMGKNTRKLTRETSKGAIKTFRHPLRNPGHTIVTALGVAAPFVRVGSAGVVATRGAKTASRAAQARNLDRVGPPAFGGGRTVKGPGGKWGKAVRGKELKKTAKDTPGYESPRAEAVRGARAAMKQNRAPKTRTIEWLPTVKAKTPKERAAEIKKIETLQDAAVGMSRTRKEANILQLKNGKKATYPIRVVLQASDQPITRTAQNILDRTRSPKRTRKKAEKTLAYAKDVQGRLHAPDALGFVESVKKLKTDDPWKVIRPSAEKPLPIGEYVGEINAGVRAGRLLARPGYIPPNWAGAQATNLIQMGPKNYFRMVGQQRKGRKSDKTTARALDRAQGETIGQAVGDTGHSGPLSTVTQGWGTSFGKAADRAARNRSLRFELERQGIPAAKIPALIKEVMKDNPNPAALQKYINAVTRGEKAAIKFTRSRPLDGVGRGAVSAVDQALARNIFLYKWITGSGQYTGRMLAEHPTLSAFLAQQGKHGPHVSDLVPEYPEFMERYLPMGDKLGNLQAASLFDMPGDVLQNLVNAFQYDRAYAGENLQPFQHALLTAWRGKDLFRGQDVTGDEAPGVNTKEGIWNALKFANDAELRSIPALKLLPHQWSKQGRMTYPGMEGYDQSNRLFEMSNEDVLAQFLAGSVWPLKPNKKAARRMKKQQDKERGIKPKGGSGGSHWDN